MEAIADQLAEFGGPAAATGLVHGDSWIRDDGPELSPGWPLRAVPAGRPPTDSTPVHLTQTDSAAADNAPANSASPDPVHAREPLGLAEIGRLLAEAAAAAPS